ncbi:hypothetical protein U1Q18_047256 [Sarracenia purpurea var. burkii]
MRVLFRIVLKKKKRFLDVHLLEKGTRSRIVILIFVNGAPADIRQGQTLIENSNNGKQDVILQDDSEYQLVPRAVGYTGVIPHNRNSEIEKGAPTGIGPGQGLIENSNDAKQEAILGEDDSEYELVSRAILPENNAGVIRNSQVEEQGSMERINQRQGLTKNSNDEQKVILQESDSNYKLDSRDLDWIRKRFDTAAEIKETQRYFKSQSGSRRASYAVQMGNNDEDGKKFLFSGKEDEKAINLHHRYTHKS